MYVLNANHISKSYKTAGETMRILQNVNLQVMKENSPCPRSLKPSYTQSTIISIPPKHIHS